MIEKEKCEYLRGVYDGWSACLQERLCTTGSVYHVLQSVLVKMIDLKRAYEASASSNTDTIHHIAARISTVETCERFIKETMFEINQREINEVKNETP